MAIQKRPQQLLESNFKITINNVSGKRFEGDQCLDTFCIKVERLTCAPHPAQSGGTDLFNSPVMSVEVQLFKS
jgi:hypothetical protein